MQQFTIPGRLPGYNELKGRCWQQSMKIKNEAMRTVQIYAAYARIKPVCGKVSIKITCFEKDHRRDADNVISGAAKVVLDALQGMGILKNDNRRAVEYLPQPVQTDKKNPRIVVEIERG